MATVGLVLAGASAKERKGEREREREREGEIHDGVTGRIRRIAKRDRVLRK